MDSTKLKASPLFDGLPPDELEQCAALFQEAEILAGSGLTREGDFAYKFFVLLDGEAEVLRGFERVASLTAGDCFGEAGVLADAKRNARVVATTRCHVAWVMAWDFKKLTEEHPIVAGRLDAIAAARQVPGDTD